MSEFRRIEIRDGIVCSKTPPAHVVDGSGLSLPDSDFYLSSALFMQAGALSHGFRLNEDGNPDNWSAEEARKFGATVHASHTKLILGLSTGLGDARVSSDPRVLRFIDRMPMLHPINLIVRLDTVGIDGIGPKHRDTIQKISRHVISITQKSV